MHGIQLCCSISFQPHLRLDGQQTEMMTTTTLLRYTTENMTQLCTVPLTRNPSPVTHTRSQMLSCGEHARGTLSSLHAEDC